MSGENMPGDGDTKGVHTFRVDGQGFASVIAYAGRNHARVEFSGLYDDAASVWASLGAPVGLSDVAAALEKRGNYSAAAMAWDLAAGASRGSGRRGRYSDAAARCRRVLG
ncbi:MAG: hypothetical protein ACYST6_20670 [Planctomycetota bacterium]